ncbi:hypothetical protein ACLK1T_23145 [Escherichia coli]
MLMIIGIFKGAQPPGWSNWTIGKRRCWWFCGDDRRGSGSGFSFQGTS